MNSFGQAPVDTTVWNARVRLYPAGNICEKNALFTPQNFDTQELGALAAAIDAKRAENGSFCFVDIGANVGLYSLFTASRGGPLTRVLALEPQPGVIDRLLYNVRANKHFNIDVLPVAVTDSVGEIELVLNTSDRGGARLPTAGGTPREGTSVRVPCRPLLTILQDAAISTIDAMKIDIEGSEGLALGPFLRDAPDDLLPRLLIIEDQPVNWSVDVYGLLGERGLVRTETTRENALFRRPASQTAARRTV